jgi:hypothetical protein
MHAETPAVNTMDPGRRATAENGTLHESTSIYFGYVYTFYGFIA